MEAASVPGVFRDGVALRAGLSSPFFLTNPEVGLAELENPLVAVYDSDLPPPGLRGPSEEGHDAEAFLKTRLLPEAAARSPVVLFCARFAPVLQTALVLRKLRGLARVALARFDDAPLLSKLLAIPLITSPADLSDARRYVVVSRVAASSRSAWIWTAPGRAIPASRCEDLVVPCSSGGLKEAFDLWRRKRDLAVTAPFGLPPAEEGKAALAARSAAGQVPAPGFEGRVLVWEELLGPKIGPPLAESLRKLPGRAEPLLLVMERMDPAGLEAFRAAARGLPFPVLVAAGESAPVLEDLAMATGAQPLLRDLGLPLTVLDPGMLGRFRKARWKDPELAFEGGGDAAACQARARGMHLEHRLAETDEERREILDRWKRFSSVLPGKAGKDLR